MTDPYDYFLDNYTDEMSIKYAETGADREMDFDLERELEKDYHSWIGQIRRDIIVKKSPDSCLIPDDTNLVIRAVKSMSDIDLLIEAKALQII